MGIVLGADTIPKQFRTVSGNLANTLGQLFSAECSFCLLEGGKTKISKRGWQAY